MSEVLNDKYKFIRIDVLPDIIYEDRVLRKINYKFYNKEINKYFFVPSIIYLHENMDNTKITEYCHKRFLNHVIAQLNKDTKCGYVILN